MTSHPSIDLFIVVSVAPLPRGSRARTLWTRACFRSASRQWLEGGWGQDAKTDKRPLGLPAVTDVSSGE